MLKAAIFDVFGTLTDWRAGVAAETRSAFSDKPHRPDPEAFATAWRAEYDPAMARIRDGARGYVALDILHRENLDDDTAQVIVAKNRDGATGDCELFFNGSTGLFSELKPTTLPDGDLPF